MSEMPRCWFDRLKSPYPQIQPGWPSSLLSVGVRRSLSQCAHGQDPQQLLPPPPSIRCRAPERSPDMQVEPG